MTTQSQYSMICECVNCDRIFPCSPSYKTKLCPICDTPELKKLKWEGKLDDPCNIDMEGGENVLILPQTDVKVQRVDSEPHKKSKKEDWRHDA